MFSIFINKNNSLFTSYNNHKNLRISIMADIPEITWFDEAEKTDKELDSLTLHRFNIKNFSEVANHKLDNYYIFKINDPDKESKTGFYGMCIQKEFAKQVKNNLDTWKKMRK